MVHVDSSLPLSLISLPPSFPLSPPSLPPSLPHSPSSFPPSRPSLRPSLPPCLPLLLSLPPSLPPPPPPLPPSDDHGRVVLALQENTPGSDYINGSYIDVSVCVQFKVAAYSIGSSYTALETLIFRLHAHAQAAIPLHLNKMGLGNVQKSKTSLQDQLRRHQPLTLPSLSS